MDYGSVFALFVARRTQTTMIQPTVSVIYVNFNTTNLLLTSLRSLRHVQADLEVVVVDNASQQDPLEDTVVDLIWPGAKILRTEKNVGFGRACNLGAEVASGELLWFLNTDTVLDLNNGIKDLIEWLRGHRAYAAASPLLIDESGATQAAQVGRSPTLARIIAETLTPLAPILLSRSVSYRDSARRDVGNSCAASLFVRADVFAELGGFDPTFFFFLEDTDLCSRITQSGYRIRHFTEAFVTHLEGGSLANQLFRKRMYYDGLDRYFAKWRPRWERRVVQWMSATRQSTRRLAIDRSMRDSVGFNRSGRRAQTHIGIRGRVPIVPLALTKKPDQTSLDRDEASQRWRGLSKPQFVTARPLRFMSGDSGSHGQSQRVSNDRVEAERETPTLNRPDASSPDSYRPRLREQGSGLPSITN